MRVFFFGDIAQLVERLNGIEKVRGSTPLISTIHFRVQNKGFSGFLVFPQLRPNEGWKCGLQHFTTLYNTRAGCPIGRKVCTQT